MATDLREVFTTTDFWPIPRRDDGSYYCELREVGWRVRLSEAILGHHLDVLFGASLLDAAAVAERDAVFCQE